MRNCIPQNNIVIWCYAIRLWNKMYLHSVEVMRVPLWWAAWCVTYIYLTYLPLGNFRYLIFQIISVIDDWVISCELALRWMLLDLTDDKSTMVQVMAWCRQATSHYLSQCWPRSLLPYSITRPQWVNTLKLRRNGHHFVDDVFKHILFNENVWISIRISLSVQLTIF